MYSSTKKKMNNYKINIMQEDWIYLMKNMQNICNRLLVITLQLQVIQDIKYKMK